MADYCNVFRAENGVIDAYDELIVTTANRRQARFCRGLAIECDTGVPQDPAIGITASWQRQLNHGTHLRPATTHGNCPSDSLIGPNSLIAC